MLKTMSMRLRGATKSELDELGIDTEGMQDARKSVVKMFKSMAGIDIMEGKDYKSTFQILDELHDKWESLSDAEHAALTEAIAGKRGGTVMASLMQNWEDAREVIEKTTNVEQTAKERSELIMQSAQAKLNVLKANAQEFSYEFINSDALKVGIDLLNKLLEGLTKITEATHGLVTGLGAVGLSLYVFNTFTGLITKAAQGFKAIKTAIESKTAATIVDTGANIANEKSEKVVEFQKYKTAKANKTLAESQTAETATETADTVKNLENATTEGAKGAAGVGGGLGTGLSAGAMIGIGAAVAALTTLIGTAMAVQQRNEELQESARTLGNSFKESANDIDGYKERIAELRKTIDSSSSSYDEAKEARQQLLGIQDELIKKFGDEESVIRLTTDAINGQSDALDRLKARQWQQTKNEYNATKGTGWTDMVNHAITGTADNIELLRKKMYNSNASFTALSSYEKEFLQKISAIVGGEFSEDLSNEIDNGTLELSGSLEDILDKLYQIQELSEDFQLDPSFKQEITDMITAKQAEYDKYSPMADQLTFNDAIAVNYKDELQQMETAYDDYQEAILNKDNETAEQAKQNMVDIINSLEDADVTPEVLKYFRSKLFPDIQADLGKWELAADLELTPVMDSEVEIDVEQDSSSQALTDLLSDMQQFSSENDLMNFNAATALDTQSEAYSRLSATAKLYGLEISDLISLLREMGALSSLDRDNNGYLARGIEKARGANYGTGRLGIDNAEKQNQALYDAFNRLSDEDYEIASTFGATQYKEIATAMNEAADASGEVVVQGKALDEILAAMISKTKEEKGLLEETAESLSVSDRLSEIQSLTDGLDKLKKVYEDVANGEEFDWSSILNNEDFKKAFTEFEGATEQSVKAYEDFINTVSNNPADIGATQEAFNNLVTSYIEETGSLENVTQATRDRTVALLEGMGVTNAATVVDSALADAEARLWLEEQNVSNVTPEVVAQLFNEGVEAGNTETAMYSLIATMNIFNNSNLSVADKIEALRSLATEAGVAASAISGVLGSATNEKGQLSKGYGATLYKMREKQYGTAKANRMTLDDLFGSSRTQATYKAPSSPGSKSGGGGGGGSAKDTKEQTDALKELSSQLDEIQAAYSSLSEIVKEYNENGKLTVDQAQALINTDFKYLAMLTDQNGQLQLNEEGFRNLTMAKIQEMQVQLALNAVDAVNNLQTEADAVNFLTFAYEGLAGKTLAAAEAQLQFAVAAAKARGAAQGTDKIGEAADKILAGYNATKQAIGNVDLGSGSLAGKKDEQSKDDKDKKDTEKKQEDTKTRFNWLDRLVNKIQRTIDQLAKRAEKYFNYQEKNALVDKQLVANQRMINTQELSVDYYQNKASKALKKVPKKYRNLVSGDFDPATVKKLVQDIGSSKTEKLQEYMNWQELLEKAQDALSEAYDQERNLIASKLDNILDYFDTLIDYQQNIIEGIKASRELATAKGQATDFNSLMSEYATQKNIVDNSANREAAYKAAAAAASAATKQSYANQISNTATDYQTTTSYQKLNDKKKKQAATKRALNSTYQVLAEDVDAFIAANKTYEAGKNKKASSSKYKKAMEAKKVMDQLHKKYTDYLAELQREESEALASQSVALANQIEQNTTATQQAATEMWTIMRNILDEMGAVYDKHIASLSTIVGKYTTIANLLKDVELPTVESYGVGDLFEISTYGDATRTHALSEAIKNTKSMIAEYQEQYNLYEDLIEAVGKADATQRKNALVAILNRNDLTANSKQIAQQIASQLASNNWDGNTWVDTWKENLSNIISAVADAIKQVEDYGDELADSVTQSTQRIIDSLYLLQQAYASKASLINDDWVTDTNGLTDYGYAKISALSQEIDIARQRADQYRQQIADITANRDNYSTTDDYNEAYNTAVKNYYDALSDAYSTQNEVYELAKKIATSEIDSISRLVENYKKALNAKKAYYDYDKQLKDKNKNIQTLTAEINALTGVSDAASKARLKSLQAELEEAQQDLDDTVFDHSIQVESDALDKLIEDMTNALNDSTKTIQQTFEDFAKTVSSVMEAAGKADTGSIYDKVINFIMTGSTAGKYYDNGIDTTEGTVSHTTTTSDTSSTTVADELENGSLVPVTLGNTLTGIDSHLLSVLAQVTDSQKLQTTMANNMNYLPNISAKVDSIASGVGSIASNTSTIAGQLSNIQNTLSKNGYGGKYLNLNSLSSYQLKQLRKLGITRIYY